MPFVQRVVTPSYLARPWNCIPKNGNITQNTAIIHKGTKRLELKNSSFNYGAVSSCSNSHGNDSVGNAYTGWDAANKSTCTTSTKQNAVTSFEFESVSNITLSNALRQLASLVLIANDIFVDLNKELQIIGDRTKGIKIRINGLVKDVDDFNPKFVTVPESDLETYVQIKEHFQSKHEINKSLFIPETRSKSLRELYELAAKTPISIIHESNSNINDTKNGDNKLHRTPALGELYHKIRTKVDVDIETRIPAAFKELRKWTSSEALGDITVPPDCISRIGYNSSMNNSTIFKHNNSLSEQIQPVVEIDSPDRSITPIIQPSHQHTFSYEVKDLPLDHRLPSPEEQCQIIASKFPAEVVTVDTSGRRFDRMCLARKSMINYNILGEENTLEENGQLIKRRERTRKTRGKRRNTLAGTDQKEIEDAANGELTSSKSPIEIIDSKNNFSRSKSSDVLKKDLPVSLDTGKVTQTRFDSLKQWGRNRFRLITKNEERKDQNFDIANFDVQSAITVVNTEKTKKKLAEKERKILHERKPLYSSSEKNVSVTLHSNINPCNIGAAPSMNAVKLRESSSIRRQRKNCLGQKDEPQSSSGNWSASSESGRTSIGSEITVQPKSSASSTSLNHSNLHSTSGPPSSIVSRRRFLNTSASSSVTSEGTITPDLQVQDSLYDDETSSAYSCDTEGYYTSFHVDSGLKTLKEEDPMTPLHMTSALSSNLSFDSSNNQNVVTTENEYELFGRGSTSTTTSSAGTVCTTLMADDSDKSLVNGPAVPERKSSLVKSNQSNSSTSICTLERSYSSSTVGSTLERTGTIKKNGILLRKEVIATVHKKRGEPQTNVESQTKSTSTAIKSPDSGNNTNSLLIKKNSNETLTQGIPSISEFEYSESSDLEGVDRTERIRIKTEINSSRIPSMCIITPTTSDDEAVKENNIKIRYKLEVPTKITFEETDLDVVKHNKESSDTDKNKVRIVKMIESRKDETCSSTKGAKLQPRDGVFVKLKEVLPNLKKPPNIESNNQITSDIPIYDELGEYVSIADIRKNKNTGNGIYYSNDIVKSNLATVLSGNLNQDTEYISLNELPCRRRCQDNILLPSNNILTGEINKIDIEVTRKEMVQESSNEQAAVTPLLNEKECRGARLTLDAQGKVVYCSDSLKRRKGAHTTFAPGPCVKDPVSILSSNFGKSIEKLFATKSPLISGGCVNRKQTVIRPVVSQKKYTPNMAAITSKQHQTGNYFNEDFLCLFPETTINHKTIAARPTARAEKPNLQKINSFQRNSIYWTLQHRRYNKKTLCNFTKDDINIDNKKKYLEHLQETQNKIYFHETCDIKTPDFTTFYSPLKSMAYQDFQHAKNISPINPCSTASFKSSTPLKTNLRGDYSPIRKLAADIKNRLYFDGVTRSYNTSPRNSDRSTESREQQPLCAQNTKATHREHKTCVNRLGIPKTTLMDFKKLLLTKKSRNTFTNGRLSAVEMLKLNKNDQTSKIPSVTNDIKILEISRSPKSFTNRRNLKHRDVSSPFKSTGIKKSSNRVINISRTDVMSTAIPEANTEEDSSSFGEPLESKPLNNEGPNIIQEETVVKEKVNLKNNIFLQAEKNNFMKGELKLKSQKKTNNVPFHLQEARTRFAINSNFKERITTTEHQEIKKVNEKKLNDLSKENVTHSLETAL